MQRLEVQQMGRHRGRAGAEVQSRCRGAEQVQNRCRGGAAERCRYGGAELLSRWSGGGLAAEVIVQVQSRCIVQRC